MKEQAPVFKEIDIPSGKLIAGGELYFIQNRLSTVRYVEYLKRLPKLTFGVTFPQLYDSLSKIYMINSSGNDMIYACAQSREISWNQLKAIKDFDEREILDVIDFCALFLNKTGEDVGKFDKALHDQKADILQKEGYDHLSFFQLAFSAIENYGKAYQKIKSAFEQNEQIDITLS